MIMPAESSTAATQWPDQTATYDLMAQRIEFSIRARMGSVLRNFRVLVGSQGVSLIGDCGSYYHKQMVQETARPLCEGLPLRNAIEVICRRSTGSRISRDSA